MNDPFDYRDEDILRAFMGMSWQEWVKCLAVALPAGGVVVAWIWRVF